MIHATHMLLDMVIGIGGFGGFGNVNPIEEILGPWMKPVMFFSGIGTNIVNFFRSIGNTITGWFA